MGEENKVYCVEFISEIIAKNRTKQIEILKQRFVLNASDDSINRVDDIANNMHLENLKKAKEDSKYDGCFFQHNLKCIDFNNQNIVNYKFKEFKVQ